MTIPHHEQRRWAVHEPELTPLLPFVYVVWADGVLSPTELGAFGAHVDDLTALSAKAREQLGRWLDPAAPPTPAQFEALQAQLRIAPIDDEERALRSLTDLGLALWEAEDPRDGGPWREGTAIAELRALERALGLPGAEAARRAFGALMPPSKGAATTPTFDAAALNTYLDRDHSQTREVARTALRDPALSIPLGLAKDDYRERVLEAVRVLAKPGLGSLAYPEAYGGKNDHGASIAAFETLAFGDLSVVIKFGVQFGLFGGSILQLGTERHHRQYLRAIGTLALPGCYAMTETGHGSNVRDLETTATHDPSTDDLVVQTPHEGAGKDWIGNAACHGQLATVFARLVVAGVDHGVHAVLVPIRDPSGHVVDGVRIEDRGLKVGLNGVDNGRIWFDGVRVPRANLLDRFATIDDAGTYHSPIPSSGRRFFTMLGTLVAGRVSIAAASVSAAKVGLSIAIPYTDQRRQFGAHDAPEQPLLDYLSVQRALLPRLATAYAAHFAIRRLESDYAASVGVENQEVEVAAAALKAYASESTVETLQACREACGGQGYLAENRFAALKADTDVFTTFEGANGVLYQLVAKGLLSRFREEMTDLTLWRVVRHLAERAETGITELNPVITRRTDAAHLLDPHFHMAAFKYREERLLRSVASRLRSRLGRGIDSFHALNEVQDHAIELARAHAERLLLERFQDGIAHAPTPGISETLASMCALFALSRIESHRGWYLESGYLEAPKSKAVRPAINVLCHDIREHACLYVEALGVPSWLLPSPSQLPS